MYFDKMGWSRVHLDFGTQIQTLATLSTLAGLGLWDEFRLIKPEEVDRIAGSVQPVTPLFEPCQS